MSPAIRIAEDGFLVCNHLGAGWKATSGFPEASSLRDRAYTTAESRRIYGKPGGGCHDTGDILRNPDYASTLRTLAERGADDFYHGSTADRMAADLADWIRGNPLLMFEGCQLNLVTFRHANGDRASADLLQRLNERGRVFLTHAKVADRFILRACVGQRTTSGRHVDTLRKELESAAELPE